MTWMPIAPLRFVERMVREGDVLLPSPRRFLQQCWAEHTVNESNQVIHTGNYRWEDVPLMDEADAGLDCWSKDE